DNQTEKAEKIFSDLKKRSPSPEIAASIKTILANKFINENKWLEARKSLEESLRIQPNLNTLKILLRTLATLQDDQEAYNVAKELESQGRGDEQVTATKAQAARNLNLLAEAEQSYSLLVKKKPLEPEYAFKLADVLLQQDELSEALATLHPFIDCHSENFNLNCLYMACELHSMQGDDEEALQLLEKCFGFIKDEPQLLMRHLDLCFRTGPENEKKAIKSQSRLQILKQEGKISDELFAMKGVDDVVEILKQRHETAQKIDMEYRTGRVARLMVCEWRNKPLYLDWAVRTQELSLNGENPSSWVNFTVYATNGIRVDMFENRNQLVQYSSPSEAKEIVVDYHALITIHRLGLLERLNNAFSKIYYPQILKLIWRVDQKQFRHHQPSQEIIYHSLNEKIELGQIREIVAPEPSEGVQAENNSPLKRNLRLAKLEELPLLDAYDGKKEFEGYQDVYRVTQIIRWLYKKGKLSENKLSELEKITAGSHNIIKEATPETLDKVSKLLVDITTLEILEQNGLVQLLLDLGIQIIVEKFTADNFRRAVLELRFGERVGKWHQDLAKTVKSLPSFQGVSPQYDVKKKAENFTNKPHLQALLDCLVELENKKSFLLTDDRFMQMAVDQRHRNKSFGTDILLKYLYEKDIISLKEYADKFLQLCKWRYRFLIPDTSRLVYFAHEFKTNPPGTP
ncbi:MAG: hypothetical protein U9Q83_06660, partial [Bacteroidota bacterium]|nr:hypothetical protein [Bacteroidota bacterium]